MKSRLAWLFLFLSFLILIVVPTVVASPAEQETAPLSCDEDAQAPIDGTEYVREARGVLYDAWLRQYLGFSDIVQLERAITQGKLNVDGILQRLDRNGGSGRVIATRLKRLLKCIQDSAQ